MLKEPFSFSAIVQKYSFIYLLKVLSSKNFRTQRQKYTIAAVCFYVASKVLMDNVYYTFDDITSSDAFGGVLREKTALKYFLVSLFWH